MQTLYKKSIQTLELPAILDRLASFALYDDAKDAARSLFPADDTDDVRRLMAETSEAVRLIRQKGSPPLSNIKNPEGIVRRAERGGILNMSELLSISALLRDVRRVKSYSEEDIEQVTVLDGRFDRLYPNKYLEDSINSAIISDEEMSDSASPTLYDLRRKKRNANAKVRETLQRITSSSAYSKYLQEAIITQRDGRYVVPVKSEHKGEVPGLVHDVSSSGATFFIEPMQVVQLNNEIRELTAKEKAEIERILAEFSAEVAQQAEIILENYRMLAELDLIFAKGKLSYDMRASEPEIRDERGIYFRNARHPLLNPSTAVPITVRLGEEFDTLIITGPNTGGKTVALKTIGLLTVMAMCGLHIPADYGSYVSVFTGVYADIGDEQSIEQSLSTFSSHMTNIVSMLDKAHPDSLMLFDELGAGTDPVEGAALAVSLIEYTRSRGAVTAATTHYAELKEYAISTEGVENASCEFDVNTLKPTYRLLIGIPGKSNAFAISKRLGLSDEIIENAKKMIDSDDRRFEDVVSTLEQQRRAMEEDRAETARLRLEAEQASKNASKYLSEIESERKKARDRANAEARQIVENVRAEVDSVLRELSELRKMSSEEDFNEKLNKARSDLRRRLNTAEDELRPYTTKAKAARPVRPIVAGDTVRMVNIGSNAYVITPPDSSGNLTVQAGIMKVTLNIDEVELVDTDHAENATKMYRQSLRESRRIRQVNDEAAGDGVGVRSTINELDIRGMASDEAILELERFIDNALLSGLTSLTIIHGKGTGTLRAAVQRNLRSNRHVKSFRPGRYGEGETGVTIVELTN